MRDPDGLSSPRFIIAYTLILGFIGAYGYDPKNAIMQGALISALSSAIGFWLGSSTGAAKNAENVSKMADAAVETAKASGTLATTAASAAGVPLPTPAPTAILQPGEVAQAAPEHEPEIQKE